MDETNEETSENGLKEQNPNTTGEVRMQAPNQSFDLYEQIARSDSEPVQIKKKNKSLLMQLIVSYMRLTLYFDSLKHTHEVFFRFLSRLWMLVMGVLYLSGIIVLVISVYNQLQLPVYLEDQLRSRNIEFGQTEYEADKTIVRNLKSKDGLYTVDTMVIYSSFSDLLQRNIRLVTLDGLSIHLDKKGDFDALVDIPKILAKIHNPSQGRLGVTIKAVTVNNAKLIAQYEGINIPISFSVEGIYDNKPQVVIPISVDQEHLRASGTLSVSGAKHAPEWLLSISEGIITLPRSSPENLSGTIKMAIKDAKFTTLEAKLKLGYGTIEKGVTINLKKAKENKLSGSFALEMNNLAEKELITHLVVGSDDIVFAKDNAFQTNGTLSIDVKKLTTTWLSLTDLRTKLPGQLICPTWDECHFKLENQAPVTISKAGLEYKKIPITSRDTIRFTLAPTENLVTIKKQNPYIVFNTNLQDVTAAGTIEGSVPQLISLKSKLIQLNGALVNTDIDKSQLQIKTQDLVFRGPQLQLHNANIEIDNILQQTTKSKMLAQKVQLPEVPLLSQPFALSLNMVGERAIAKIQFTEDPINILMEGQFSPLQKTFSGKVVMPPVDLNNLKTPLHTLWPLLPKTLAQVSGKVAAAGQITWRGGQNVSGPLSVGFQDISFTAKAGDFSNLNAVLTFKTLIPPVTLPNQRLYIQTLANFVPFQNLDITFQLDNQAVRVNQMSIVGGGVPLVAAPAVISLKGTNTMLYLKNRYPITESLFNRAMNLKGITVNSGTANVTLPIEIQNDTYYMPNLTFKLTNAALHREGDSYPELFGNGTEYFARSGQIVLNWDNTLQISLNGRQLPSKTPKDVQLNNVKLPDHFFNTVAHMTVPKDIKTNLIKLFGE